MRPWHLPIISCLLLLACSGEGELLLSGPGSAQVFVGERLDLAVEALPCSQGLRFTLPNPPEGLVATVPGSPCRLELSWTPIPGQESAEGQPLELEVEARDREGKRGHLLLELWVFAPWSPSWNLPASWVLTAGQASSRALRVSDPAASGLGLQTGPLPAWFTVQESGPGDYRLEASPPLAAAGEAPVLWFQASGQFTVLGQAYEAWVLDGQLQVVVLPPQAPPGD